MKIYRQDGSVDYYEDEKIDEEIVDATPSADEIKAQKLAEIEQLKEKLVSLDYKTIKRMQGKLSDAEWEETCDVCDELRKRINQLESEVNNE